MKKSKLNAVWTEYSVTYKKEGSERWNNKRFTNLDEARAYVKKNVAGWGGWVFEECNLISASEVLK